MNIDSTCEKSPSAGKSGTYISTIPCKDPRAPKRRLFCLPDWAVIVSVLSGAAAGGFIVGIVAG